MTTTSPAEERFAARDFLLRFVIVSALVVAMLAAMQPLRSALLELTILTLRSSVRLVGLTAWTGDSGLMMFSDMDGRVYPLRIVEECTAVAVGGLFLVGVLSVPQVPARARALGAVYGLLFLFLANWLRLVSVAWVGVIWPQRVDALHAWLWQIVGVALVIGSWLVWLQWVQRVPLVRALSSAAAWFSCTLLVLIPILYYGGIADKYARALRSIIGGLQSALNALPYATVQLALILDDWVTMLWSATFALCVALVVALGGESVRGRLGMGLLAVPCVILAQVLATVFELVTDARMAAYPAVYAALSIPLLVVSHSLPVLVPLTVWLRAAARANGATSGARPDPMVPSSAERC